MKLSRKRFLSALCVLPLLAATHAAADQETTLAWPAGSTIYFYNGGHPDAYNQAAEGWILSQMMMLGASGLLNFTTGSGSPAPQYGAGVSATSVGAGDGHANSPGSVLRNSAGERIGYANAQADKFAFDLDKVNMNDMLALLPNLGKIVIAKHGYSGGVTLDGGDSFPGFTGRPYPGWGPPPPDGTPPPPTPSVTPGQAYPLPNNGPAYDVYVNSCFSDDGPSSVCNSARAVTRGVVTGNDGLISKGPDFNFNGTSPFLYWYLYAFLAGFTVPVTIRGVEYRLPDVDSYLGSLSFDEFDSLMRATPTDFTISWSKTVATKALDGVMTADEYVNYLAYPPHYYLPPMPIGSEGGTMKYGSRSQVRPIELEVPPGALADGSSPLFIDFRPHPDLVPAGFRPMTQFVHVDYYALNRELEFAVPATLTLHLDTAFPEVLIVARIDEHTGAITLMEHALQEDGLTCNLSVSEEGTYVAVTTDDGATLTSIVAALTQLGLLR